MYKLIMRWARFSFANAPTSSCPTPAHRHEKDNRHTTKSPTIHRNSSNFSSDKPHFPSLKPYIYSMKV